MPRTLLILENRMHILMPHVTVNDLRYQILKCCIILYFYLVHISYI